MTSNNPDNMARRQLLVRTAKAAAAVTAATFASYLLYDRTGPRPGIDSDELVRLPDFSVPAQPSRTMAVVRGADRTKTANKAIELLGGIERFVKPGETVVIKPNIAFASPPILGATTNPELVAAVATLCRKAGAKVLIMDNPINDPAGCFTLSGIAKAAKQSGARIIMPRDNLFRNTTLAGATLIKDWPLFFEPLGKADRLIGIAPVKNHSRSGASMTMKNWYGLLGGRRNIFHQDINTIIAELAMLVKPTLVILDGTEVMMTNGPTGGSVSDLKRTDTLIACTDQVAADAFGSTLLGLKPQDLPYLAKAQAAGAGTVDYESLKPIITALS